LVNSEFNKVTVTVLAQSVTLDVVTDTLILEALSRNYTNKNELGDMPQSP
jgi:hypothetical protein